MHFRKIKSSDFLAIGLILVSGLFSSATLAEIGNFKGEVWIQTELRLSSITSVKHWKVGFILL